jgi:glutathione S-transferase
MAVLYSFRRCPYAMRARMGLIYSRQTVELREVVLRDKPPSLLEYSPKATVPVLVLPSGQVIDESIDVMRWGLDLSDPDGWLAPDSAELINKFDHGFKGHLDRYKYSNRYDQVNAEHERLAAFEYLLEIERILQESPCLFGDKLTLADVAIAPFVRQFANTDRAWFDSQTISGVQRWLSEFLNSTLFTSCMQKYPKWKEGDAGILFPEGDA